MELRQLRYFIRVAELGSFSKAASFLKIAQPALSRQIRNLEDEFNEILFIRDGRGVKPTPIGNKLLEHARGVLRQVDRTYDEIEHARTGKLGRVTIGMPKRVSVSISTPLVYRLRAEIPEARLTLLSSRSSQLQEWLLSGKIDMALVLDAPNTALLESCHISSEYLGIVGTPGVLKTRDPISLKDIENIPIIVPSRPNKIRILVDTALAEIGGVMDIILESDFTHVGVDLTRAGLGCSIHTTRFQYQESTSDLFFRKIIEPEIMVKYQIVRSARGPSSMLQDKAFNVLRQVCEELLNI